MRRLVGALASLAVAAALVLAWASPTAAVRDPIDVKIATPGSLQDGGQTAVVRVTVRCEPGWVVLEALVTVSQPVTYGEGYPSAVCDGRWHRSWVTTFSYDAPFEPGEATASAYILLEDPTTFASVSGGATRTVKL
jgi:hypothetical protein